jgi:hypothetical protein
VAPIWLLGGKWRNVDCAQLQPRGNSGILFPEPAIFLQLIADNSPIAAIIPFTRNGLWFKPR